MSFFNNIFGSSKRQKKAPSTLEAIAKLKETIELLEKKTAFIENKVQAEILTAKLNASKNKKVALQALRKKKRLEKQLCQIDGSITSLEFHIEALESANTNVVVLGTMRSAADALKKAQMDPDQVHDIMDDIAEQKDLTDEITEAISMFGQSHADVDEDDLIKELEELENENIDSESQELENLPEAPTTKLPKLKERKEDEDSMKELAGWAS